jgi:hypothetical protein
MYQYAAIYAVGLLTHRGRNRLGSHHYAIGAAGQETRRARLAQVRSA